MVEVKIKRNILVSGQARNIGTVMDITNEDLARTLAIRGDVEIVAELKEEVAAPIKVENKQAKIKKAKNKKGR